MSKPVLPGVEVLDLEWMGNYFNGQRANISEKHAFLISDHRA